MRPCKVQQGKHERGHAAAERYGSVKQSRVHTDESEELLHGLVSLVGAVGNVVPQPSCSAFEVLDNVVVQDDAK